MFETFQESQSNWFVDEHVRGLYVCIPRTDSLSVRVCMCACTQLRRIRHIARNEFFDHYRYRFLVHRWRKSGPSGRSALARRTRTSLPAKKRPRMETSPRRNLLPRWVENLALSDISVPSSCVPVQSKRRRKARWIATTTDPVNYIISSSPRGKNTFGKRYPNWDLSFPIDSCLSRQWDYSKKKKKKRIEPRYIFNCGLEQYFVNSAHTLL